MNNNKNMIVIPSQKDLGIFLRSVGEEDIEKLRVWKNAHRFSFFYQKIIEPAEQISWFEGFCAREHDYMFMVCCSDEVIGCMGFRLADQAIDVYNVILGLKEYGGRGLMSKALTIMIGFIKSRYPQTIIAKVLNKNPALEWYKKNGFKRVENKQEYILLQLTD